MNFMNLLNHYYLLYIIILNFIIKFIIKSTAIIQIHLQ